MGKEMVPMGSSGGGILSKLASGMITLIVLITVGSYLISDPTGAATGVGQVIDAIKSLIGAIFTFISTIAEQA